MPCSRGCIGIGHSAATHHLAAITRCSPISPACGYRAGDTYDAKAVTPTARNPQHIVVLVAVPDADYEILFGQAAVVREGRRDRGALVMVQKALQACDQLAAEGVSVDVTTGDGDPAGHANDPEVRGDRAATDRRDVGPTARAEVAPGSLMRGSRADARSGG